ncbi:MAG: AmmeMemoRadiSam system protein B [Chromatiales bacterium]|nr:AmmeMemoRadiSam system protein B [Chromatiales bacterium]
MTTIRQANVAGLFYPDNPAELGSQIRGYLAQAPAEISASRPKALIAPHAGYIYSGPIAASAYRQLQPIADQISRVIILAPAHRMAFRGLAVSEAEEFETPLGKVEVDCDALLRLQALAQVRQVEPAFANEHSIEVQLPFLQTALQEFKIVPLLVSNANAEQVSQVLELLWGGPETLIVISSDLSHYLSYEQAKSIDKTTTQAIEALQPSALSLEQACGGIPIQGLLLSAKHHNLHVTTLDLRNSGDTAGTKDRVVGYGAYVFS